jgi:hypothetical protein
LSYAIGYFRSFDADYQAALGSFSIAFRVHTVEFVFRQVIHYSGAISVAEHVDGSPEAVPKEYISNSFEQLVKFKYYHIKIRTNVRRFPYAQATCYKGEGRMEAIALCILNGGRRA